MIVAIGKYFNQFLVRLGRLPLRIGEVGRVCGLITLTLRRRGSSHIDS